MFYEIMRYNHTKLIIWATSESDAERYVDWLNRDRKINLYAAYAIAEEDWPQYEARDDVLSADEPGWDDFMYDSQ